MSTALPTYVDIPGRADASVIPPGVFTGARSWVFAASGDRECLQALADQILSAPTGGALKVIVPSRLVLFMFYNGDKLASPRQPIGWTPNHECVIAFPVILHREGHIFDYHFGLLTPFVYIDNYRGMVTGRESWGYFKNLGNISAPKQWSPGFTCSLDTLNFQPASPDTEGVVSRLVTVNSTASEFPTDITGESREQHRHLMELIAGHIEGDLLDIFWKAAEKLLPFQVSAFNLKQFRDVADGTKACYQAVTASPLEVNTIHSLQRLPPGLTISIETCANAGLAELLGLEPSPIPVQFAVGAELDYQATAGEVLWQA